MADSDENRDGLPLLVKLVGGLMGLAILAWFVFILLSFEEKDPRLVALREQEEAMIAELEPDMYDDHAPLRLAVEKLAKAAPLMHPIYDVPEEMMSKNVVGVSVGQTHHAYVIDRQHEGKNLVLLTTNVEQAPIVILHNYHHDKTFVFSEEGEDIIDISFGGYDLDNNIVLLFNGVRYVQDSDKLPLERYPYERMTLQEWSELHPNTFVNYDEALSDKDYFEQIASESSGSK